MTVNDIVDELRGSRPRASEALRLQVLTLAASPPGRVPSLGERLRARRRLLLALPAAAVLAVLAAVAIGVTRPAPSSVAGEAVATVNAPQRSVGAAPPATAPGR